MPTLFKASQSKQLNQIKAKNNEPWFKIEQPKQLAEGGKTVIAYVYGTITSYAWDAEDVEAKSFIDSLNVQEPFDNLELHINSPGGEVYQAQAIYSTLKAKPYNVNVYIDGIAASAASIIAMAGNKIMMPAGSVMMIHKPMNIVYGNANEMRKMADTLDKVEVTALSAYKAKTKLDDKKLTQMMNDETWMSGEECVSLGFADELLDYEVTACIDGDNAFFNNVQFDLSKFKNRPPLPLQVIINKPIQKEEDKIMTLEELKTSHPDLYKQIVNDAVTAEKAIQESFNAISSLVDDAFLQECKGKGMTAETTMYQAAVQGKTKQATQLAKGAEYMDKAKHDASSTKQVVSAPQSPIDTDEDTATLASVGSIAKNAVQSMFKGGRR